MGTLGSCRVDPDHMGQIGSMLKVIRKMDWE